MVNVFVLGATGFIGGAVARHLLAEGHLVRGLARSHAASKKLQAAGVEPVSGDLQAGLAALVRAAAQHDVVVVAAQLEPRTELAVVTALLDALDGTGKTLLFTSGSGVLLQRSEGSWSPDTFTEDDEFRVEPLAETRRTVENLVRSGVHRGVRGMVVRAGMVWGPGDHGHVSLIYRSVGVLGAAAYVGEGLNVYSHVHVDDVARLFSLANRRGAPGALYHAVAGETPMRWIAESVAADLGVATRSLNPSEAVEVWGEFDALLIGASSRIRARRSRRELGWAPTRTDLLDTVGERRLRALAKHKESEVRSGPHRSTPPSRHSRPRVRPGLP